MQEQAWLRNSAWVAAALVPLGIMWWGSGMEASAFLSVREFERSKVLRIETKPRLSVDWGDDDPENSGVMALSENSELALLAYSKGIVVIMELKDGKHLKVLAQHKSEVIFLGFLADDKTGVSAAMDGKIHFFEIPSGKLIRAFTAHKHSMGNGDANALVISDNGRFALTWGNDEEKGPRSVKVWDLTLGKMTKDLGLGSFDFMAISADGKRGAFAFQARRKERKVLVKDLQSGAIEQAFESSDGWSGPIAFGGGGKKLVLGRVAGDGWKPNHLVIWDLEKKKMQGDILVKPYDDPPTPFFPLLLSSGSNKLVVPQESFRRDTLKLEYWDLESGKSTKSMVLTPGQTLKRKRPLEVKALALSRSGEKALLAVRPNGPVALLQLWDLNKGTLIRNWSDTGPELDNP